MIKEIISSLFILPLVLNAAETPLRNFRFVEAKSIKELSSLPPKLELTLEIMCNEEFIKVIRHEWIDPKSKKVTIAVGALVRENLLSSCAGEVKEVKATAGDTFSGREFEISRIKR
jgi:hypothetical protein